jgi:hypothetical protein
MANSTCSNSSRVLWICTKLAQALGSSQPIVEPTAPIALDGEAYVY